MVWDVLPVGRVGRAGDLSTGEVVVALVVDLRGDFDRDGDFGDAGDFFGDAADFLGDDAAALVVLGLALKNPRMDGVPFLAGVDFFALAGVAFLVAAFLADLLFVILAVLITIFCCCGDTTMELCD